MTFKYSFAIVLALFIAGCAQDVYMPHNVHTSTNAPYRLDSGDSIRLIVFGEPNLTNTYKVGDDGYISMPLIGGVPARGRTPFELEGNIAGHLRQGYIRNPDVTIEVAQYRPFYVLGKVQRSGQYTYAKNLTVENAIAMASGYTQYAKKKYAVLNRQTVQGMIRERVPLNTTIRPGDTIIIE